MAVGINMPGYAPQKEKKVDPLDRIIQGLNIATTVYGIKNNIDQSKLAKLKEEREAKAFAEQIKQGDFDRQTKIAEMQSKGFDPVVSSDAGPVRPGEGGFTMSEWARNQRQAEQDQNQASLLKTKAETSKILAEANKAKNTPGMSLTEAEKNVDRDFGKEYGEWTSGGRDRAYSELEKLGGVIRSIDDGNVTTGGLTGVFPDRMTSNSVLSARADVNSTVMNSLRAILGAQFTEKEGDRIIRNTWNEADSTANNKARVERLVQDLRAQAIAKDAKSQFYEQNRTLQGFKTGPMPSANIVDGASRPQAPGLSIPNPFQPEAKAAAPTLDISPEDAKAELIRRRGLQGAKLPGR